MNNKKLLEEKLREAACFGDLETLKELVLRGVDLDSKNDINGWTALHWAACRGHADVVSVLLSNGANPTPVTHNGDLPCSLSTSETIQALLGGKICHKRQSSLPIIPNYLKYPPLFCSVKKSEKSFVRELTINSEEELILKLRIAESLEPDFIEIEFQKSKLTFTKLKEVCCKELSIKPDTVLKIRKLPNTIIRNDRDVQRLTNFQELEIFQNKTE